MRDITKVRESNSTFLWKGRFILVHPDLLWIKRWRLNWWMLLSNDSDDRLPIPQGFSLEIDKRSAHPKSGALAPLPDIVPCIRVWIHQVRAAKRCGKTLLRT